MKDKCEERKEGKKEEKIKTGGLMYIASMKCGPCKIRSWSAWLETACLIICKSGIISISVYPFCVGVCVCVCVGVRVLV